LAWTESALALQSTNEHLCRQVKAAGQFRALASVSTIVSRLQEGCNRRTRLKESLLDESDGEYALAFQKDLWARVAERLAMVLLVERERSFELEELLGLVWSLEDLYERLVVWRRRHQRNLGRALRLGLKATLV
jgi:hypothetical protein